MTLDDVVAKVRANGESALMRNGEADVDFIAQQVVEILGLKISNTGVLTEAATGAPYVPAKQAAWEPPGGLTRAQRTYRKGFGRRK